MTEMVLQFPFRALTLDDLQALPDDGRRYEIVDGSLIVSPPPSPWHQSVATVVQLELERAAPPSLRVLAGGAGIGLRDDRFLVPDVIVVMADAVRRGAKLFDSSDVALVVEVVSPSNAVHDLVTKRAVYAAHGIDHYWIVDSRGEPSLIVLRRRDDIYAETACASTGIVDIEEPFPLRIDVDALFGS